MFGDLECPYALKNAAANVARTVLNHVTGLMMRELVMLASGPDATSIDMIRNTMTSLDAVGLGQHILLITDSADTCEKFDGPCYWSSRVLHVAPSNSITMQKFWDWRFRFYYVKKAYLSRLVTYGFSVIQADTDTLWNHDPFPVLRSMPSSLIIMRDIGSICNAGLIYARPGSRHTRDIIDEVAWRVQLFQNYPDTVARLVHYAKPPYYANSDDQTILDDVVLSAVLRNRSWLSTFRWEAKNRYKEEGVDWASQPEYKEQKQKMKAFWSMAVATQLHVPWINATRRRITYFRWALPPSQDSFSIAPDALFALLPYHPDSAVIHLTAARGFKSKVFVLKKIGKWLIGNTTNGAAQADGALAARERHKRHRRRAYLQGQGNI